MKKNASQPTKQQKVWSGVAFALLICSVMLGITSLNTAGQTSNMPVQQIKAQIEADNARLELTEAQKSERLERVKFLRDKWKAWALSHQGELRRMLSSREDRTAQLAVWNMLPSSPSRSGGIVKSEDFTGGSSDMTTGRVFTWNAASKNTKVRDSKFQKNVDAATTTQTWRLGRNFKDFKDIEISSSVNTGRHALCLWASGRVTESSMLSDEEMKHIESGDRIFPRKHREILPPYDFLQK